MIAASKQIRTGVGAANNPLRSELIERIPIRFETGCWDENLIRLKRLNFRAAIVGRKGSGKTCLLEQLQHRIGQHYVNLSLVKREHCQRLQQAILASKSGEIVLLDGIERLSFWQRQQLLTGTKQGPGLVVTVHRPCRLPTWIKFRTNFELMKNLLSDLQIATPEVLAAGEDAFRQCRGNVREAFRMLYDEFAQGKLIQ